jgi:hypothetical protein
VIAFPLFIDGIEVLFDILIREDPLQLLSQNLFAADLKILFGDGVEDLNSSLVIGKHDRFLKIS